MSADNQFKTALSTIVTSVSNHQKILDELKTDNAMMIELLNTIYQMTEDMSKKFDEVLNIGIKKPIGSNTTKNNSGADDKSKQQDPASTSASKSAGAKNKAAKPESTNDEPPKVIKNIMTFFKTRYVQNPNVFNDILDENQAESIFAEQATEIASKKEGVQRNKFKAAILYKKISKAQIKKIRDKMMDEHDSASVNNDDDVKEADESS
jgi:hypothetical protein